MTPEEIVSRIPPAERTKALAAFLAIDKMDYAGMDLHDRLIQKDAYYTDLHDQLVAAANTSLERDQASTAPAVVKERYRAQGSGGIRTLRSKDKQALLERAQTLKASIDSYRSPSIGTPRLDALTGDHVVEVRYYGLG